MGDFENVKARADLKEYAAQHLRKSSGGAYCCPACGSGTHGGRDSDGALTVKPDGTYWKCHSCQRGGDVFDLAGIVHGVEDKAEKLRIVAEWAGVTLEKGGRGGFNDINWADVPSARTATESGGEPRNASNGTDTPKPDYTAGRERHRRYIAECAERLREMPAFDEARLAVLAYLFKRGIG